MQRYIFIQKTGQKSVVFFQKSGQNQKTGQKFAVFLPKVGAENTCQHLQLLRACGNEVFI